MSGLFGIFRSLDIFASRKLWWLTRAMVREGACRGERGGGGNPRGRRYAHWSAAAAV